MSRSGMHFPATGTRHLSHDGTEFNAVSWFDFQTAPYDRDRQGIETVFEEVGYACLNSRSPQVAQNQLPILRILCRQQRFADWQMHSRIETGYKATDTQNVAKSSEILR